MSRIAEYRDRLRQTPLDQWEPYLRAESRLPGPRGNLELAHAVADLAGERSGESGFTDRLLAWAALDPDTEPTNTPGEFLAFCGVLGIGEVAARADGNGPAPAAWAAELRRHAADSRWRVREAVAQALQRVGDRDLESLRAEAEALSAAGWLERRAAMAAVCEPRLLKDPDHAAWVVDLLDRITRSLVAADDASDHARVLRKALGYGWSVAIVASPAAGRAAFKRWAEHDHPDARWIVRENLKKNRLRKFDADWVASFR